jgi:hypothetical protein
MKGSPAGEKKGIKNRFGKKAYHKRINMQRELISKEPVTGGIHLFVH